MARDSYYIRTLLKIAVPVGLQQLLFASFSLIDTLMMGQMGEQSITAVALANQVSFVYNLILFGITSGAAVFVAQYWGAKDIPGIRRVSSLTLLFAVVVSTLIGGFVILFPETAMRFYTKDADVIALGSQYLRIIGFSYVAAGISNAFTNLLRSTHDVKIPTTISVIALLLNMAVDYVLIFGKLGFPVMGVRGAAVGTLAVRVLQCGVTLAYVYVRKSPAAFRLGDFRSINFQFVGQYFKTAAPVLGNEVLWSFAITSINSIYAHISTNSMAAVNITSTMEQFMFTFSIGIGSACGIMVGNEIGAGRLENAKRYGLRSFRLSVGIAAVLGVVVALGGPLVTSLYNISEETRQLAIRTMIASGALMWVKTMNMAWLIGILRPGGDTRFAMLVDGLMIWITGVGMALLGAQVFHLPVYWVYVMAATDEIVKSFIYWLRFRSGKWVNILTHIDHPLPVPELAE